jgi:argininosuccinate synthase
MRIVLGYAGGVDASEAVHWLRETHRADVIAVTLDLGQGRALEAARDRALATGAVRAHVIDAREEFARQYVLPTLLADAVPDSGRPNPRALGIPLLGQTLVEIARIERAVAVACLSWHDLADLDRLEAAVKSLNPALSTVKAPPVAETGGLNVDLNLWGRTLMASRDPDDIPESAFVMTRPLAACPDEAAVVELAFEDGRPTSINSVNMPILDLIQSLGTIAGAHGVGRFRAARGWVEAPAAVVLHEAHRAVQTRTADPELQAFARTVSRRYAEIVERGGWFLPLRDALDAFVARAQAGVTGTVRLRLFKAHCESLDRTPVAINAL